MKISTKHIIVSATVFFFCALVILTLGKGLKLNPKSAGNALENKPAKSFNVQVIQGANLTQPQDRNSFTLSQFKGRPLIINFWASWCLSCRTEAHELETFWKKHESEGVQVLGIAIHDTTTSSEAFIKKYGKTYAIGLDTDGKAGINYGVIGVPETFFIDSDGIIKHKIAGPVNRASLEEHLPKMVRKKL